MLVLGAALAARPALAQAPPPAEILRAWEAGWDRAAAGVQGLRLTERLTRDLDGPRGRIRVRTDASLRYDRRGRTGRRYDEIRLGRRRGTPERLRHFDGRLRRSLGSAADLLKRPAPLPGPWLGSLVPRGQASEDRVDGARAWRVDGTRDGVEVAAWFTRDADDPRLLRLRLRYRTRRADGETVADYARAGGLDVPTAMRTEIEAQQRRRVRVFTVLLTSEATYAAPELVRE